MVTWGSASTKTYTPSTPASTAPSPAGFSVSSLGNAPASGTTPTPATNLFAGSTPGPTAGSTNTFGGFGSFAPSPAATGTAPTTSAFGSSTTASPAGFGGFGSPPANAASPANTTTFLSTFGAGGSPYHHAHVAAHHREEQSRIETQLLHLANGYSTNAPSAAPAPSTLFGATPHLPPQMNSLCRFQCLLYDPIDMTPGSIGNERPLHISVSDWAQAQAYNPDPTKLKPVSIVGADALQARVVAQQEKANKLEQSVDLLKGALDTLESKIEEGKVAIEHFTIIQVKLEQRMLNFMFKLHLIKCALMGRQGARIMREERDWINKMYLVKDNLRKLEHFCSTNLRKQVEQVRDERNRDATKLSSKEGSDSSSIGTLSLQEQEEFHQVLEKTQVGLQELKKIVTRDARDIQILMKEMSIKKAEH